MPAVAITASFVFSSAGSAVSICGGVTFGAVFDTNLNEAGNSRGPSHCPETLDDAPIPWGHSRR